MGKIILTPELRAKFNGMDEPVELCDETGNTVGRFLPEDDYVNLLYEIAKNEPVDEKVLGRVDIPHVNLGWPGSV